MASGIRRYKSISRYWRLGSYILVVNCILYASSYRGKGWYLRLFCVAIFLTLMIMNSRDSSNLASDSVHGNNVKECEFGNFQATHGWIECESTTYPGEKYFYNLRTRSKTWIRPVSKHVQLHSHDEQSSIYNNNLTSDLDDLRMVVSSETEDDDESENAKGRFHEEIACKKYEIFLRFYCSAEHFNYPNDDADKYFDDNYNYIPNPCCGNNNFFKLRSLSRSELFGDTLGQNDNFKKKEIPARPNSSANVSNPSEIKLCAQKNNPALRRRNGRPIRTTSYNKEKESSVVENYCVPRGRKINSGCLLGKVIAKKRSNNRTTKENPNLLKKGKLKAMQICEMYGTRTFNYDNIEPELPPEVKSTNLSDSSVASVLHQTNHIKPAIPNSFELPNANFNVHLSSTSSTSSSSCTCSSCTSSTSSDTNSTISSKSNSTSKRE